jgi:hypothetical protein
MDPGPLENKRKTKRKHREWKRSTEGRVVSPNQTIRIVAGAPK